MVERLAGDRAQGDAAAGVGGGGASISRKSGLPQMEAAARREQHAAAGEQSHRTEVDVLVAAKRGVDRRTILGEGRRVEHDRLEASPDAIEVAEIIERVGFDERDVRDPVARAVLLGARRASAETSTAVTESARRARCSANEP